MKYNESVPKMERHHHNAEVRHAVGSSSRKESRREREKKTSDDLTRLCICSLRAEMITE